MASATALVDVDGYMNSTFTESMESIELAPGQGPVMALPAVLLTVVAREAAKTVVRTVAKTVAG